MYVFGYYFFHFVSILFLFAATFVVVFCICFSHIRLLIKHFPVFIRLNLIDTISPVLRSYNFNCITINVCMAICTVHAILWRFDRTSAPINHRQINKHSFPAFISTSKYFVIKFVIEIVFVVGICNYF